ncbi:hypothetical protein [Beduini massiliensis]|nr:hypothetical protein [Beduini massiliensis]
MRTYKNKQEDTATYFCGVRLSASVHIECDFGASAIFSSYFGGKEIEE